MQIDNKIKEKIFAFIISKKAKEHLARLPEKGYYSVEFSYELALHDKLDKYVFVVSDIWTYHNYSISDKRIGLYAFDINTGVHIPDFESKEKCYIGFFNDLKIVESII